MAWRRVYVKEKSNKMSVHDTGNWSEKKKAEALQYWIACGNLKKTSAKTQIPYETLKKWKQQDWWLNGVKDAQTEEYTVLDTQLSKGIDKSLTELMKRMKEGDSVYDPKTGTIKQVPVKMRDLNTTFHNLLEKQMLIRKQPTKIVHQDTTANQLKNLAEEFAKFVTGIEKKDKLEDVSILVEGEDVVQNEDGTYVLKEQQDAVHVRGQEKL